MCKNPHYASANTRNVVLRQVQSNLESSARVLGRQYSASDNNVHGLRPDDYQQRIQFYELLLQQHEAVNAFIIHILSTDKECFTPFTIVSCGLRPIRPKVIRAVVCK